jgi:alkylation response protein AidB-like acyl-CoA dehydrogenase
MAMETVTDKAARWSPAGRESMAEFLLEEAPTGHLAAARQLEPLVAELRDRFDAERQLPVRLVDRLRTAGVFRMWLPRSLGGAELAPLPFLEVIEELSREDGSVGWCAVIAAGSARLAGALDEGAAREIFGAGEGVLVGTLNPVEKATPVRGGYR